MKLCGSRTAIRFGREKSCVFDEAPQIWGVRVKGSAMIKALFNDDCNGCGLFRPRCATVYMRANDGQSFSTSPRVLCDECRKSARFRGDFKVDDKHKYKGMVAK